MKKRFAFTLLEILVSLPLISILFSFLIFMLVASTKHHLKIELKEKKVLQRHYFQKGLQKKLSLITKQKEIPKENLGQDEVLFHFQPGISKLKELSQTLTAQIYLHENTLMLSLYQSQNKVMKKIRDEALLDNVKRINFEYFFEEKRFGSQKDFCPYYLTTKSEDPYAMWVALKCFVEFENLEKRVFFFTLPRGGS